MTEFIEDTNGHTVRRSKRNSDLSASAQWNDSDASDDEDTGTLHGDADPARRRASPPAEARPATRPKKSSRQSARQRRSARHENDDPPPLPPLAESVNDTPQPEYLYQTLVNNIVAFAAVMFAVVVVTYSVVWHTDVQDDMVFAMRVGVVG